MKKLMQNKTRYCYFVYFYPSRWGLFPIFKSNFSNEKVLVDVSRKNDFVMRIKILIAMGAVILITFLLFGVFALPVGITISAVIGILGALKSHDRSLLLGSVGLLAIGIVCIIYTLVLVYSM